MDGKGGRGMGGAAHEERLALLGKSALLFYKGQSIRRRHVCENVTGKEEREKKQEKAKEGKNADD